MGTVYRAVDRHDDALVAVKILGVTSGIEAERFRREARTLGRISHLHPTIVTYIDHGTIDSKELYLAMEWLEGEDLGRRLGRVGLAVDESLALVRRVASALAVAHEHGVVHRDIKPSNVFLVGADPAQVKLLDFGLARSAAASMLLTKTGLVLGTAGYMAPEQVVGATDMDARVDVFALGCVLFECLTGQPAFPGDRLMAVLAKLVLEQPPSVTELRPELAPCFDEVLDRMLVKDRADRYADGAEVLEALERLGQQQGHCPAPSAGAERALTGSEQRLLSIVVLSTGPPEVPPDDGEDLSPVVRGVVEPFGAELLGLGVGVTLAVIQGRGNAADLALRAARCALALRAALPDTRMVLVTGVAELSGRWPVGPVIERAAKLLEQVLSEAKGMLFVDAVSGSLLESRFEIAGEGEMRWLRGEQGVAEGQRRLLGRLTPCVGRQREVSFLKATLEECLEESAAQLLVVNGAAGVGKSRLRHEFINLLIRQWPEVRVLSAQGDPVSAGSAFSLVAQLVRRATGAVNGDPSVHQAAQLSALLEGVAEDKRGRIVDFLLELLHQPRERPLSQLLRAARNDARIMHEQLCRAFVDFIDHLAASRPLLVVLEDLHWGDQPSVDFLGTAVHEMSDRPLMVLALTRPEVSAVISDLWSTIDPERLMLRPLRARASRELVRAVLGDEIDDALVDQVVEQAGGNAFYLEELIRHVAAGRGAERMPVTVLAMVQSRLDSLESEARQVLRAASIFGASFWAEAVRELIGDSLPEGEAERWLDALVARELLEPRRKSKFPGSKELRFRHELLRGAVYATLTGSDRELGHQLAADWLRRQGERDELVLAEHYDRGGDHQQASRCFFEAAKAAVAGGHLTAAEGAITRAIDCGADGEEAGQLKLLRAQCATWRGDYGASGEASLEALELLGDGGAPWLHALGLLAYSGAFGGNPMALMRALQLLMSYQGELLPIGPAGRAAFTLLASLLSTGQRGLVLRLRDRIEAASEGSDEVDLVFEGWLGLVRAHIALYGYDDLGVAVAGLERAQLCFSSVGDHLALALTEWKRAWLELELGRFEASERASAAVLALDGGKGTVAAISYATYFAGLVRVLQDRCGEAIERFENLPEVGNFFLVGVCKVGLAMAHLCCDRLEEAKDSARQVVDDFGFLPVLQPQAKAVLAEIALRRGEAAEAIQLVDEALEQSRSVGITPFWASLAEVTLIDALNRVGETERAAEEKKRARARLERIAATLEDQDARRSFLSAPWGNKRLSGFDESS